MIGNIPKVYYFTDRKKIAEEIKLPENNDFAPYMIIAPNEVGTGYKQLDYDKYKFWFNVHMTKDQLKKMILGFNSAHTYALAKQKQYEQHTDSNFCWHMIQNFSLFSFILAAIIFVYVKLYDSKFPHQAKALQISFFAALVAVMSSILLTLMSCKSIPKFKTYQHYLDKRMEKVVTHFNKKYAKKGLKIVPGKKYVWLEIWKTKAHDGDKAPIISLIGREPIVDYTPESLEDIIEERNKELQALFKRRFNTKYKKIEYLQEFYTKATARKEKVRKAEEQRIQEIIHRDREEAKRLALVPEKSAFEESSEPHVNKTQHKSNTNMSAKNDHDETAKEGSRLDRGEDSQDSKEKINQSIENKPNDDWRLNPKEEEPLRMQDIKPKVEAPRPRRFMASKVAKRS